MRVLIETYREWEIYFDTESEDFYTVSNQYDSQKTKRSYAATKSYIDDFIKNNTTFKPIKVHRLESNFGDEKVITLIGIRKDGRFIYQDEDGEKGQLSNYNETDYFLLNEANEPILKEISDLRKQINEIHSQIKQLDKKLIKVDVKQLREKLFGGSNQ